MPAIRSPKPERWAKEAGAAEIATLDIPAHAQRSRVFEVDVRLEVRAPAEAPGAWHALKVECNGAQQWLRRVPTHNPGQTDSLEWRTRREVGLGQALRVRAIATSGGGTVRLNLRIEAEEQLAK